MVMIFADASASSGVESNSIIARAWEMLSDTGPHKRNVLTAMVAYLNDGIHDVLVRRPYLLLQAAGTRTTFTDLTVLTYDSQPLPFGEELYEGVAHYITSRVFEIDSSDEHNASLAVYHNNKYVEMT